MKLTTSGDKKFQRDINKLIRRVKNPREPLRKSANIMFADVQTHFRDESGPKGKWPPLSARYLIRKRKKGVRGGILVWSGRMKKLSFSSDNRDAYVGTNVRTRGFSYPSAHQLGLGNNPKRQFLWLSKSAGRKILNVFFKYIDKN